MAGDTGDHPAEHSGGRQRYRSPFAVVVWWLWALFALANLTDLAVQGRDHFSLETAAGLLLITGTVYVAALRPRITADDDGLTIVNPFREHQVSWAGVAAVDASELVRVRCAWPVTGEVARERVIYAWAVHSSRRKQAATRVRAERRRRGGSASGGSFGGGFGDAGRWPAGSPGWRSGAPGADRFPAGSPGLRSGMAAPAGGAPAGAPGGAPALDAEGVAAALSERAEQARSAADAAGAAGAAGVASAVPPVSCWHWPSLAAVIVPALALIIIILL